ncbi:MAG: hypothetical protein AB6733_04945 [Clostridiaceae bacterium]
MVNEISFKKEILLETYEKISDNFKKSIDCNELILNEAFEYFGLLKNWCVTLEHYEANVVLYETNYSILSSMHIAFSGFYREAYLSLRSALESACYFIFFVDNNYSYLKWKENIIDINWSNLKDADNGILSEKYLNIFDNKADIFKLLNEINSKYRICSEYVHGKYNYMFMNKFSKISFDDKNLLEFLQIFLNISRLINSLLLIRFNNYVGNINSDYRDLIINDCKRYGISYQED